MNRKLVIILPLVILAIVLGFLQENIKVNINYILDKGENIPGFFDQPSEKKKEMLEKVKINAPFDYYHNHSRIDALFNLSHSRLVMLKWSVTVVFVIIFMVINATIMRNFTGDRIYFSRTIKLYGVFFLLAFIIFAFGKLTSTADRAYGVSREIVGGLQSLVPLMILIPASWLLKNQKAYFSNEKTE